MALIYNSLVLGTKANLIRILPLIFVVSTCTNSMIYYRGFEVEILGVNGRKTTIRYKKTGVTQEVKSNELTYSD